MSCTGRFTLLLLSLVTVAFAAHSRPLSDNEIAEMVPAVDDEGKLIVRHRWQDSAPINVVVITDRQPDACVGAAISQLQAEVDLLRSQLPTLKVEPRVTLLEWVPEKYKPPMLLIALPMEDKLIERGLFKFAREANPAAKFVMRQRVDFSYLPHEWGRADDPPDKGGVASFDSAEVQGIERGYVTYGHRWTVNYRGIEYYTGRCGWGWSKPLLSLLGANQIHYTPARGWEEMMKAAGHRQFEQIVQRLFLQALYSTRDAAVDVTELRRRFGVLINEPSAFPVPRAPRK